MHEAAGGARPFRLAEELRAHPALVRSLKVAREWGVSPSTFLAEWSERDRGLALALRALEDTTGPHGFPLATELDSEQDGRFRAVQRINFASRAVELAQQREKNPDPGAQFVVVLDAPMDVDEDDEEDAE